METEHFQTPFRVITLVRIFRLKNPQHEGVNSWLLSKLHVIRVKLQSKYDNTDLAFSRIKPHSCACREKSGRLFGLPLWELQGKVLLFSLLGKK